MHRSRTDAPTCAKGHVINPAYSREEARRLEILVFYCEVCDERWQATPEERDVFLRYLDARPGNVVPS
jgi:hypothetical protein